MFFGVTDDGCIESVDEKVKEHCKMKLKGAIEAYIQDLGKRLREFLIDTQCFDISAVKFGVKYVIVISVNRSQKVNYYVNTGESYIRKGATSFKMTSADEREQTDLSPLFSHE